MGRGVSSGGGQSSLGYLFGSDKAPKSAPAENVEPVPKPAPAENVEPILKPAPATVDNTKQIPEGIQGKASNNYFRADGQNCGNFITVNAHGYGQGRLVDSRSMAIPQGSLLCIQADSNNEQQQTMTGDRMWKKRERNGDEDDHLFGSFVPDVLLAMRFFTCPGKHTVEEKKTGTKPNTLFCFCFRRNGFVGLCNGISIC